MYENSMSPADYAAITRGSNDGDGAFGGNGAWWIIVLFLFMWGRGGWGGYGAEGGGGGGYQGYATRADINEGFALNNLDSGIRSIQQGICDSTYAINNAIQSGFNATQMGMMQGFNGVERGFCNLSAQLAQCCCETQRGIDGVNFNLARGLADIGNVMNANTRSIIDFLTQDKIAALTAENQSLKFAASQSAQNAFITANQQAQTAELIRRLGADCPTPAYVVQPPTPVTFPTACGCSNTTAYGYASA